jgi:LPS export ABC transporter protein LptC
VAIAVIAFLAVLWAMVERKAPTNTPRPTPAQQESPEKADSVLKDFVYTATDQQGLPQWRLTAETATHYREKNTVQLENLKLILFTDEEKTYIVTAAKGIVNTETQDFEISGTVTGISDDGVRFSTESLRYRADIKEARSEDRVVLESPQFKIEGRGMIMDVQNQEVSLLYDVQATVKDNQP